MHFLALPGTRADRLFWVLEVSLAYWRLLSDKRSLQELGIEYNVQCHARAKGGIPQSLKDVTKLGKVCTHSPLAARDVMAGRFCSATLASSYLPGHPCSRWYFCHRYMLLTAQC